MNEGTFTAAAKRKLRVNGQDGLTMLKCSRLIEQIRDFDGQTTISNGKTSVDGRSLIELLQFGSRRRFGLDGRTSWTQCRSSDSTDRADFGKLMIAFELGEIDFRFSHQARATVCRRVEMLCNDNAKICICECRSPM